VVVGLLWSERSTIDTRYTNRTGPCLDLDRADYILRNEYGHVTCHGCHALPCRETLDHRKRSGHPPDQLNGVRGCESDGVDMRLLATPDGADS
jgi:hypothetical protein